MCDFSIASECCGDSGQIKEPARRRLPGEDDFDVDKTSESWLSPSSFEPAWLPLGAPPGAKGTAQVVYQRPGLGSSCPADRRMAIAGWPVVRSSFPLEPQKLQRRSWPVPWLALESFSTMSGGLHHLEGSWGPILAASLWVRWSKFPTPSILVDLGSEKCKAIFAFCANLESFTHHMP